MDGDRNILDDIFGQSEEDLETFMETISDSVNPDALNKNGADIEDIDLIKKGAEGESLQIEQPEFIEQIVGRIHMQHGWDGSDYAWHISTMNPKIMWAVNDHRICYGVARIMNEVIPQSCEVKIWLPLPTWEIVEYTFKALGLRTHWQITDDIIEKMNTKLFEVLNTMV